MPILTIPGPLFYSQLDEKLFFDALNSISGIEHVKGVGRYLHIRTRRKLSQKANMELTGLLRRYRVKPKKSENENRA